jgi:polysaccharide biosynthesis transport protein
MKLNDYINPLVKWWWLLLITTLVAGVSSYFATRPQPPIYRANATVMVGRGIYEPNPTGTELGTAVRLAESYALLAQGGTVQNGTMEALGLNDLPEYTVVTYPNNQLLSISVIDINPLRAQAVANELAHQLIRISPTNPEGQDLERQAFINQQLDNLQLEIMRVENEIIEKQASIQGLTSAVQIADTETAISALETKKNLLQTNYATLISNTQSGALNTLTLVEPATLPIRPIGPNKPLIIFLVSTIGFVLAALTAHLLEYLDRSLKTPEDIERVLNLPVIGFIGEMDIRQDSWAYMAKKPRSPIAEAFRAMRTNIEFAGVDKPLRTILITSADAEDGKTTVASNLAIAMAHGDRKVILMDADMRRGSLHSVIGFSPQPGLSDVFRDRVDVLEAVRSIKEYNFNVITAGLPPANPSDLLASKKMANILSRLEEVADTVIIDGPPSIVSDAAVLASKVDGVLLVIRPGQTREEVARAVLEQMTRVGANVIGVALNRIPRRGAEYYGGFQYLSPAYTGAYYSDSTNGHSVSEEVGTVQVLDPEMDDTQPVRRD